MTDTAPPQNRRMSRGIGAVIVVAVALLVLAWLLTRQQSDGGTPSPTPSVAASASGPLETPGESLGAAVTWEWELHELPGGPARGAARIGDNWVALDGLEAWTSTNGAAWETATVDDTPQEADGQIHLGPVAGLGATHYSVGLWFGPTDAVHPVVWSTADGTAWTQVPPSEPWGYLANDVASDGVQLVVAGAYFGLGDGGVWTSPDAATWTEHASDSGPATLHAVHGDTDGFVAVGFRADEQGIGMPVIWHSADGASWTDSTVPATDAQFTLLDVARLAAGRYVAMGIGGAEIDAGEFVAWYTDDPTAWTDAGVFAGGSVPGLLLVTDVGVLSITGAVSGPQVHFSGDGASWEVAGSLPLPNVVARASAAASDGSTVIILGSTAEADAHFVWLGHPRTQ